ncbi:hypothetical protein Riv7116_4621 [Rivularia sp. PCC 7116]|uniref:DUF4388 domain-containing protein n=1 Tax=Rivularia sp. PCC 7116 TaxID=373994 RepID=UPI00029F465C|nr:DUF4388 domain-containing protein [Rivularia sp. PCC 7116]AFY57040.1 hypothetical protein Riv7116_4621 [Rivularia sp. PCC 7116]
MAFSGYLSKFSLPEIFEFLEQGFKTGLLSIRTLKNERDESVQNYYIWLRQGRIVAAASKLDNQGLASLINQRGWVSRNSAIKKFQASGGKMAMGLCLKSQGLLSAEQLTLLFRAQIMGQVSRLFELENGKFSFDFQAPMPVAEMTGLSMITTEATIKGLRGLRNWSALTAKLPDPTSAILKKTEIISNVQLDSQESRVWECANGETDLSQIANKLSVPLEKVRQIAFRLIVSNLAKETFIINNNKVSRIENTEEFADLNSKNGFGQLSSETFAAKLSTLNTPETSYDLHSREPKAVDVEKKILDTIPDCSYDIDVSQSFLQNLVGFLKTKVES